MFAAKSLKVSRNAILGVGAAVVALTATAGMAEAKHKHKHFGIVVNLGAPEYVYVGSGYNPCRWLKRKAIYTGSPYWWNRYYQCIYG